MSGLMPEQLGVPAAETVSIPAGPWDDETLSLHERGRALNFEMVRIEVGVVGPAEREVARGRAMITALEERFLEIMPGSRRL